MDDRTKTISDLQCTESVVPPPIGPDIPRFESHRYAPNGKAVLLVILTSNKFKEGILCDAFRSKAPQGIDVHSITLPIDSGVGGQPYNDAGTLGACNRISNALQALHADAHQDMLRRKGIGTVIVASIESYIQTDHVVRPTDFAVIVIHNATTEQTRACVSQGTTVDPRYVEQARRFGFDGHPNFGRVTVGRVLAAHVPGLDEGDWQIVLCGRSRYELLKEAIDPLELPWGMEKDTSGDKEYRCRQAEAE
jgi:non-canonical (house-cleaning) NTP pyrophosphatase